MLRGVPFYWQLLILLAITHFGVSQLRGLDTHTGVQLTIRYHLCNLKTRGSNYLVGGFNPQLNLPQVGVKIPKYLKPPPSYVLLMKQMISCRSWADPEYIPSIEPQWLGSIYPNQVTNDKYRSFLEIPPKNVMKQPAFNEVFFLGGGDSLENMFYT